MFNHVLQLLKTGAVRGLIMHKIDRGARNLQDWNELGKLADQGVDVRFAQESIDLGSRSGRLADDIQAVVAADFIRNLREETRKGFYGRLKQGLFPLPAPLGSWARSVDHRLADLCFWFPGKLIRQFDHMHYTANGFFRHVFCLPCCVRQSRIGSNNRYHHRHPMGELQIKKLSRHLVRDYFAVFCFTSL